MNFIQFLPYGKACLHDRLLILSNERLFDEYHFLMISTWFIFSPTEVSKAQAQATGKPLKPENRYVDIYKEKPIKVVTKVLVPVKEHPRVR